MLPPKTEKRPPCWFRIYVTHASEETPGCVINTKSGPGKAITLGRLEDTASSQAPAAHGPWKMFQVLASGFLKAILGFPGGAVVESLPAGVGDAGSCPGLGGSLMPRSGQAREPQLLSLRIWSLCSATREAAVVRGPRTVMRGGPRLPRLGRALAWRRGPSTAINK